MYGLICYNFNHRLRVPATVWCTQVVITWVSCQTDIYIYSFLSRKRIRNVKSIIAHTSGLFMDELIHWYPTIPDFCAAREDCPKCPRKRCRAKELTFEMEAVSFSKSWWRQIIGNIRMVFPKKNPKKWTGLSVIHNLINFSLRTIFFAIYPMRLSTSDWLDRNRQEFWFSSTALTLLAA